MNRKKGEDFNNLGKITFIKRALFFLIYLISATYCFAQQNLNLKIFGSVPGADDNGTYQIQVGAFQSYQNAEKAFNRLYNASFNPTYENYSKYTRVVINRVAAKDVLPYLRRIQNIGFPEVIIRIDNSVPAKQPPVVVKAPEPVPPPKVERPAPVKAPEPVPAPVVKAPEPVPPPVEKEPEPVPAPVIKAPEPVPAPAPRQGQYPLLGVPGNRIPADGFTFGDKELRQQRTINFSWNAVDGATAYILSIFRETPRGRTQIFSTDPIEQTNYILNDLKLFKNNEKYTWQVEALSVNNQGVINQRGQPGENSLTFKIPYTGRVKLRDTGVLYGN